MPQTVKLAEYLFTRLHQLGVGAIHGVPGDYNLTLLDYVEPAGLLWVGSANELNAGYAADGYSRIKGVGALITTYGVGELSAINAIAGAFAERAAVVHIVGTPPRLSQESRLMIHHTLHDGEYRHFGQMAKHVTVAQANLLDGHTAPDQIDAVLRQCLLQSKPVYIEVPVDMVDVAVSAEKLSLDISAVEDLPDPNLDSTVSLVLEKMYEAKRPVILIDHETRALGLVESVQSLVNSTKWPTFTTSSGNGLIDMTASNVHGIWQGDFADENTKAFMDDADLIICFGPHFSSTNSYALSSVPDPDKTILVSWHGIQIYDKLHRQVRVQKTIQQLLQNLDPSKIQQYKPQQQLPRNQNLAFTDIPQDEELKQDKVWRVIGNFLRPGDILLGETGTATYGVREMALPKHVQTFTCITWLSIGYMLPAAQGAALAQRELISSNTYHGLNSGRTILVIGDGSFQMTVQEIATMIRHNLNVVIFLINNDGYTIERAIHGENEGYNDISRWKYLKALEFFGAPKTAFTGSARTYGELQRLLENEELADGEGVRMAEVFLDRIDCPEGPLMDLLQKQRAKINGTNGAK